MKALVLENIGQIKYSEVDKPVLGKGQVLVKVCAVGVCGSDIPRAYRDGAHKMPLIIGHEFAGLVVETGDGVDREWLDKKVAIFPLIPCKKCTQCQRGHYEMCKDYDYLGSRSNGGFAEYVVVPVWNLMELSDKIEYDEAAMFEPMAVAVHAMRKLNVKSDDTVAICGAGTIGMLLAIFLMEVGVRNLYVLGNHGISKETLTKLGLPEDHFVDVRTIDAARYIKRITNGEGVDKYFECVGSNASVSQAIEVTAPQGSICYVGNPHSDMTFEKNVYWQILRKQLTIVGTWNSSYYGGLEDENLDDWIYVRNRLEKAVINPRLLITHRYSLDNLEEGLQVMRDKKEEYIKIVCEMS